MTLVERTLTEKQAQEQPAVPALHVGALCQYEVDPATRDFYARTFQVLDQAGVPVLVGGAYAFASYTGVDRQTKDCDLFVRPSDSMRALEALSLAGYRTELTFPHWLGKAYCGEHFVDIIFSSGNGVARVDDLWFVHAREDNVLGMPVRLCPVEEMIWSTSFIMERERYDGANIAHLLRACGDRLNWVRLLWRFGPHWRVLLSHIILFGFIYPAERELVPEWVNRKLLARLAQELATPAAQGSLCQGTLLSRAQYLVDIERWGYQDARLSPHGLMSAEEIAHWTRAIGTIK